MASSSTSSSTIAASTLTRPRTAIAITLATALAAASLASLGYHYYRQRYSAEQLDLDAPDLGLGSGPRLRRRNALRRSRRPEHQDERDESSGSESHDDDQIDPLDATVPISASPDGEQPEQPDDGGDDPPRNSRERTGENIVTLLFRVSEDNARRNAYVHRGCLCNGCGMLPIRGIRYRCANCPDFDLCEMCESQGCHNKAHIFYKVKIPVPSSAARQVQPPWYPGDPSSIQQTLPRELLTRWSSETGFERVELDALWEQWTFMANTEWREDPNKLGLAMDRKTFERCLVPSAGYRHPAPNLIHDRMFAFYDTNRDDLIGFEEYLEGVSYKRRKDKLKRIFDGYDVDGDGWVSRRDFLRMFRAYYVSYKQMHRDTVEGLDDYMMTNVEVQQLVSGRQPISGLFGREQRIPDGDGERHMEGKVFRPGGEVNVLDGKGAVSEDKPDVSSREDILRDLFTRASNPSPFTETFGFSRRPQSPARDSPYWPGILNPPHDTIEMGALLSGDNTQLDGILDSIRRRESRVLLLDETSETSSSEDEDDQSSPYDRVENEGEQGPTSTNGDVNLITSPGLLDAGEFIHTLPTEMSLRPQRDTFTNPQQLNSERRKRVMARRKLYERWKRRQFYLDEEEGAVPPQGWRHEQDTLANMNNAIEPSKSAPPLLSPRSRSSSKVRFAEDTDDFETRSNHSTSSRSVPERWGGMEIPDAERDAGKEILYQITQQAFNELLDILFKEKEDLAVEAAESKEEREKHRAILDQLSPRADDESTEPGSPGQSPASQYSPTTRPPQEQKLEELLAVSGYTIANPDANDEEREREVVDENGKDAEDDTARSILLTPASSPTSATLEHRDPTMPQFMPSQPSEENDNDEHLSVKISKAPTNNRDTPLVSEKPVVRPETPSLLPSHDVLMQWKSLDQAEQEAKIRGGWGRLDYLEFEEIYKKHDFQEGSKNRLAYLGSWIDFCIPS
ncbi:hypothetical protein F5Y14DRAFT_111454 [Nemania sp. NC0429]|nr:hypothetical protein F5Y14DRAFT_111454 [Nemania sp. NC0429]